MKICLIRLKDNIELIGYVEGVYEGKVKTEHLHYIRYNIQIQNLLKNIEKY
jgi:hypothetical protein